MRRMMIILCAAFLTIPVWANPGDGSKFKFDQGKIQLAQVLTQPDTSSGPDSAMGMPNLQIAGPSGKLNPGKALLLSAIIPGAGQFYAKSPIFGGVFLAAEIFAWSQVASYHSKGMSKDDEFHSWADQYWTYYNSAGGDFGSYLGYEFWVATTYGLNGSPETWFRLPDTTQAPTVEDWQALTWDEKMNHLPTGFTHNLDPNNKDQQYFEMIGKYDQFWAGWPESGDYGNYSYGNPPSRSNNPTITNLQHWTWDAYSNSSGNWVHNSYRDHYQDLRNESNNALDISKNYTMVVMGNHLLSALHAGFAVSLHNRKINREHKIEGALQLEPRRYYDEKLTMATLRVKF
jgi:hypothetical protein